MIGELAKIGDLAAARLERAAKRRRIADPAERRHRFSAERLQGRALAGGRNQPARGVYALQLRHAGGVAAHRPPDFGAPRKIDHVRTRQNHEVGPPQPFDRLSQQPAGKHVLEPERLQGVEQDDIEVPGDAAVLKAVVEHNQLAAEPLDGLARAGQAVGVFHVRRLGQKALEFQGLVVGPARVRPDRSSVPPGRVPPGRVPPGRRDLLGLFGRPEGAPYPRLTTPARTPRD